MKRIIALFLAVILALSTSAALAAEVDLSVMRTDELVKLREEIDAELALNHTLTAAEKSQIQLSVEESVESYLLANGVYAVSWRWADEAFQKDWDYYTATPSLSYKTSRGRYEPKVFAMLAAQNDMPTLYYLELDGQVLLNTDIPASRVTVTATPRPTATRRPTATPRATRRPTATPKPTATPRSYYLVNEPARFNGKTYTMLGYRTSRGSFFMGPSSGNEYLIVQFGIKVGNAYSTIEDVTMVGVCDGKVVRISSDALMECDPALMYEPTSPGAEAVGEIGFEVPRNWKKFEIYYAPTNNIDEAMVFVINR